LQHPDVILAVDRQTADLSDHPVIGKGLGQEESFV